MNDLVKIRDHCRLCGSPNLKLSVPLPSVPIVSTNVGKVEGRDANVADRLSAPLDTYLCQDCGLIQLIHVVDPALIYHNYLYTTSLSLGLADHFRSLRDAVVTRLSLPAGSLVVEFGSNDGTLLGFFHESGMKVAGVDPAEAIAAAATRKGIPTLADFFGHRVAKELRSQRGPAKVIIANNAMANIDDLDDILRGVATLMDRDGVFVFETQYALDVFENTLIDVIYHEHISCFSVQPVERAFKRYGLEVFDAERIPTKGGSIRFWVQHTGGPRPLANRVRTLIELENQSGLYDLASHARLTRKIESVRSELHRMIRETKAAGGRVAAYGISVGGVALIHQFELTDKLDFLLDDKPMKDRLEGPDYSLPIYTGDGVYSHAPALIIILAWRYVDPITAKHRRYMDAGGKFVVPLPEVRVLP
jgi:2-polyprenyl-3-methyl-5-hydroxy-6-metoxy-1,4-benzoquinol methylase